MKKVEIFTDGACKGNPGPGGWGALLRMGRHEKEMSGGEPATTNNRMELTAAIKALEDPVVQKRVAALGMSIPDRNELTPQALHDFHKAELDKWWPIIKSYGIKLQ